MIDVSETDRAQQWVDEAVSAGARCLTGGTRDGALIRPTVLT
jgi:acyl-CoA reductase-like NAD-dependent aldehyde dehydrogenase